MATTRSAPCSVRSQPRSASSVGSASAGPPGSRPPSIWPPPPSRSPSSDRCLRGGGETGRGSSEPSPVKRRALLLAASSFVAGWLLLAFEVVWFRLLRLFVDPNALTFSILLAVVLSGIGLGGLVAGRVLS